ncbi:MAG: OmpA family protein [Bradymonadales bacterium]|nr:OmpA family protein [Bradymonadales bacterium]
MVWRSLLLVNAFALLPLVAIAQPTEETSQRPFTISQASTEPQDDQETSMEGSGVVLVEGAPGETEEATAQTTPASTGWPRVGITPNLSGTSGLFALATAHGARPQTVSVGLFGEYFTAGDVVRQGDDNQRFIGHLTLSYTPTSYLEAFIGLRGSGNVNNLVQPNLIQSQGDLDLGIKAYHRLTSGLDGGIALALQFLNGADSVGFDLDATGIGFYGLLTYSLEDTAEIPLILHANLGYDLDNSSNLFEGQLQRIERFAHQVSNYDLLQIGAGLEVPLKYVTPLVEWTLGLPVGGSDLDCEQTAIPCPWDTGPLSFPHTLTIGLKGSPVINLGLNLGLQIGLTTREASGLPAMPPYNLVFGMSYLIDLNPSPTVSALPEITQPTAIETGWILGEVVSDQDLQPIPSAIVNYLDSGLTAQSTDPTTGRFRSYEFPINTEVTVVIVHPAYETRTFTRVIPAGEDGIRIRMAASTSTGFLSGTVVDPQGAPLPATMYLAGPQQAQFDVDPLTAQYERQVNIGRYLVTVVADGHTSLRTTLEIVSGVNPFDATLSPLPEGQVAVLRGDRIDLSGDRIAFVDGTDELEPSSLVILDQVAQLLQEHPDIYLNVVAHTDDSGTLEQTEGQAQAVVDYLVGLGVDPLRLQPIGRGSEEPLFPNISRRNRLRNQRVEFLFLQ